MNNISFTLGIIALLISFSSMFLDVILSTTFGWKIDLTNVMVFFYVFGIVSLFYGFLVN